MPIEQNRISGFSKNKCSLDLIFTSRPDMKAIDDATKEVAYFRSNWKRKS